MITIPGVSATAASVIIAEFGVDMSRFATVGHLRSRPAALTDPGATAYQQLHRTRELKSLRRRARQFGFQLLDQTTGEILNAVS